MGSHGHHVGRWTQEVLDRAAHEDIAWRQLEGLSSLARKHAPRLETVCRLARARELFTLKDLRAIMASGEDEVVAEREAYD